MPVLPWKVTPRKKGFREDLFEEIQNLSMKQTLGLPLSAPLTFGAGALSGLSFGLADLTDELQSGLGSFALPEKVTTSIEVAGQIGGSFIPYIGASSVASKLYQGMSLGAKMARGAFTFSAPEAVRQMVDKELDPLGAGRSLTTGALFALPRKYAAPAILGAELALGATPEEAAITAGFGALFAGGGKLRNTEIPTKTIETPFKNKMLRNGIPQAKLGTPPEPPGPPVGFDGKPQNVYSELSLRPGMTSTRAKEAAAVGQAELPFPSPIKSQVEILKDVQKHPGLTPPQQTQAELYVQEVQATAAVNTPETIAAALTKALKEKGTNSMEASMLRHAQAEKTGMIVPKGAAMLNPLNNVPKKMGVALMEPGPTNVYDVRAAYADVLSYMRAQGPEGKLKAAQIAQKMDDMALVAEQAERSGQTGVSDALKNRMRNEIAEIESGLAPKFRDAKEAETIARRQLAETTTVEQIDDFVANLPEAYLELPEAARTGILRGAAELRASRIKNPIVTLQQLHQDMYENASPAFTELQRRISDTGAEIFSKTRVTKRQLASGVKTRFVTDNFSITYAGQKVKDFKSVKKATKWLDDLETGAIEPKNIHELRMLGHTRGIVIDYTGKDLHILNQLSGEQILGVQSIDDAVRIVRNAPQVTQAAREIGPRVDAIPPMPGSGGHGGVATEQSLPFCPLGY
jgi:hypothetical protein